MLYDRKRYRRGLFLLLILTVAVTLIGCNARTRRQRRTGAFRFNTEEPDNTSSITGVIVLQDTQNSKITVRELDSDIESILHYDYSAEVTDQYGQSIRADQLKTGLIVEAHYRPEDATLVTVSVPEDVWEYNEVGAFSFQSEERMMKFAGRKYQYSDLTYISSGVQNITREDLNTEDKLTVRGVGYRVYSIVRTMGHGYIRLANYADFIGGMVEVGDGIILPVTENMLITAGEGIYPLTLIRGSMITSKTVTVTADQEVIADFSDYVPALENVGMVTFQIDPEGADLYINGTAVNYSEPVALNYGEYRIRVEMTGYDTYTGTLDVEEPSTSIQIDLIEQSAGVDGQESTATDAPSATDDANDSDSSDTTTKKVDSNHSIRVTAPAGVEVYLDNVYKGLAPCKFKKVIGSQTITLRKDGYITKSYSVDILDDDENVSLSFPELAEDVDTPAESSTSTSTP
ncbi:MAG: PEGA domain-containing protein [Lachnospiraceae bacterium]|nr:PEGA domain-containing protein [Lachnospiraceae bacterium]